MLQFFRDKINKIIIFVIVFFIFFAFLFTGFDSFYSKSNFLYVNNINISFNMIEDLSNILRKNDIFNYGYLQYSKVNIDTVSKKIFINESAFLSEIKKLKLKVSNDYIINFIFDAPYFKKNGIFSSDLYKSILEKNKISEKDYYIFLNKELLISQVKDSIELSSFLIDEEVLLYIDNIYQFRDCVYISLNKIFLFDDIFISNLDINFYKNKIFTLSQIDISCIDLYMKDFYMNINYEDVHIKNYYDLHINDYNYPDCVNIKAITVFYDYDYNFNLNLITKIYNNIKKNDDKFFNLLPFSKDDFSISNNGNIGFLYKGDFLDNSFENSIFNLHKNDCSNILLTDYGLYIFQMLYKQNSYNKDYDVIFYDIVDDYKKLMANNLLLEKYDYISELLFDNVNVKNISEYIFVKERESHLFVVNRYNLINCYNDIINFTFNDSVFFKNFSNILKINEDHYILINVNKYWPSVSQNFYEYIDKLKYFLFYMKKLSILNCVNNYILKYIDLGIVPYFFFKIYDFNHFIYKDINANSSFVKYLKNNLFNVFLSKYSIWNSKNIIFFDKNFKFLFLTNITGGLLHVNNLHDFLYFKNYYLKNYKNFEYILYKNHLINKFNVKV